MHVRKQISCEYHLSIMNRILSIIDLVCLERWLAEKFSMKTLYFLGYFIYACGCIINYYIHNVVVNIVMCVTCKFISFVIVRLLFVHVYFQVGILVVSLNTLPYHMLSNFHADETVTTLFIVVRGSFRHCYLLLFFSVYKQRWQ
jgi:hypothetical protein